MSKIDEAIAALTHAQDIDTLYPGGDRFGVRQCVDKAVEILREPVRRSIDDATPGDWDKTRPPTVDERLEALERKVAAMEAET
jgi:hypothetical protein